MIGQTGRTELRPSEQAQHALADIVKIRRTLREAFILDLLQLEGPALDRLLPRPRRAMTSFNLVADLLEDFGVIEQRQVRPENGRLSFPGLLGNLIVNIRDLLVCRG